MILKAVLTEKSLNDAKTKKYTFLVPSAMTKPQIKALIAKTFDVHVISVATINSKSGQKVTMRGIRKQVKASKKAIVTTKENIELFEDPSAKKGKTK